MALWIKLYQLCAIFWRKRFYLLIPIITMPIIGYFVGRSIPENYYSHTNILLQESTVLNPFLAELSLPFNIQSRFKAINILVKRKPILLEVAKQVGLIDENDSAWQQQQVINQIKNALKLSLTGSELIKIEMEWPDPQQLSVILSVVTEQFILRLTKPNQDLALSSKAFLAEQLNQQHKILQKSEQVLLNYTKKNIDIIPELYQARELALTDINTRLQKTTQELALYQAKFTLLTKKLILTNPAAQFIDNKIMQLEALKIQQQQHYTEQHSQVKSTNQQLARLKQQRRELLTHIQTQQSLEQFLSRIARLTQQALATQLTPLLLRQLKDYERFKHHIEKITQERVKLEEQHQRFQDNQHKYVTIELELLRLKRDYLAKNNLYLDLSTRHEMIIISNALGEHELTTNIKIVTPPFIPEQTINLPIISYILLGLLLGIIQGIAVSLTLSITQDTLWDEDQIAHVTGLKVITRLPLIPVVSGR
ncbi:GumC family protein [Moritella marina]|uniref:GumC family protein n=1 Tax=Moritella marina TaxID=90736 RepID=UPI003704771B